MDNLLDILNEEFLYDPNCPCNGCEHEGACTLNQLACRDFEAYVKSGEKLHQNRNPSVKLYHRLFPTYV